MKKLLLLLLFPILVFAQLNTPTNLRVYTLIDIIEPCPWNNSIPITDPNCKEPIPPVSGLNSPDYIKQIPLNTWVTISNNTLSDINPCPLSQCTWAGAEGQSGVINDWTSGAYAENYGRYGTLMVFGGGHSGYLGNEVYGFDIENRIWTLITQPTNSSNCDTSISEMPDGAPCAEHSGNHLVYLSRNKEFGKITSSADGWGVSGTGYVHLLNLNTKQWRRMTHKPTWEGGGTGEYSTAAYDPIRNVVWYHPNWRGQYFAKFDPSNNTWTEYTNWFWAVNAASGAAIVPNHDIFILSPGTGSLVAYDLTNPNNGYIELNLVGNPTALNNGQAGFEYDSLQDKLISWSNGCSVDSISSPSNWDTDIWQIQQINNSGPCPTANNNGTYGRFRYAPNLNVFLVVNEINGPVYALRLSKDPTSNFEERCSASGVIICEDFDDSEDFTDGRLWAANQDTGSNKGIQDTNIKASGISSLKLIVPSNTGADGAGGFLQPIGQIFGEGQTFYVQYRQRMSPEFINMNPPGTYWKQSIIYGLQSCGGLEITLINGNNRGFPQGYSACGNQPFVINIGNDDFLLQQGDTNCHYHQNNGSDCWRYREDTWQTFYFEINIGTFNQPTSHIKVWAQHENESMIQFIDMPNFNLHSDTTPSNDGFRQVLLTPYMTNKSSEFSHPDAELWYDELIISTEPIAAPIGN
jgi:hypothetical protein